MASSVDCQRSFLSCSGLYKSYHKAMISFSLRLTQMSFSFLGYCLGTRRWRISHLSQFRSNYQNSCPLEKAWLQGMNMLKPMITFKYNFFSRDA